MYIKLLRREATVRAGGKKTLHRKMRCERFSRQSKQEIAISRLDSERIRAIITVKSGFVPFVPLHGAAHRRPPPSFPRRGRIHGY